MKNIIEVQRLSRNFKIYNKQSGFFNALKSTVRRDWKIINAVNDISFSIQQGEFVGFLGPNGAGKTTTLKMLSGILDPSNGSCSVMGYEPFRRDKEFKKNIAMVMGQRSQLLWDLPAMDTFSLHRDMYEISKPIWKKRVEELVSMLNVEHVLQTPVRQLSLGERMKCETIVSLLHAPKVLFLDEPTIGLDVMSQQKLWEFLRAFQKENGTTILLTSHYMHDISNLCSRVIVINFGKLIFDGSLKELVDLTEPDKEIFIEYEAKLTPAQLATLAQTTDSYLLHQSSDNSFTLRVPRLKFGTVAKKILSIAPTANLQVKELDFSEVMKRSFSLHPSEIIVKRIRNKFNKRVSGSVL